MLPFLLGDALVARVDLRADRPAGRRLVRGAFAEPGVHHRRVAAALATELRTLAAWLHLDTVTVAPQGDLADRLAGLVAAAHGG